MENLTLFLILTIPVLLVSFSFFLYTFYAKMNNQKIIINTLINTNSKILEKSKKTHNFDEKGNFLKRKLHYAGFKNPSNMYIFIAICLAFGFLIGFFVLFVTKSKLIFIFTSIIFCFLPYLFLHKIIKVREEEFNFALKEIIDKVTNMMKSGVGFEQALKKSILTSKSQLAKGVFNIYINEKAVIGEDKCFEKMFKLIESKELRIFYLVISIGRKSGGKFSNTPRKTKKNPP
jgi:tight adherence protein B